MRNDKSMDNQSRSIQFTEIDLFEEESGISIPPRENTALNLSSASTPDMPISSFISREHHFVQEARSRVDEQGEPVPFSPFMSYWPTYDHMTESQRKWYYYWRSEVRNERYPNTDLSYIFIYVYEIINGVGWSDPRMGYELLDKISMAYGRKYPQLNGYLKEWISDFVLIHSLEVPLIEIFARAGGACSGELMDMELLRIFRDQPSQIYLELLLTLSDYDLRRSKFYLEGGKSDLEMYLPRIVALVDAYLQKSSEMKLIDKFPPGQQQITERYLFRSAVYDSTLYGRTTTIKTVPIRSVAPLREYITQIIRFTENKLREIKGFKGRLRGVSLEQEIGRLIDRYLEKELTQKAASEPAVTIDADKLALLQQDTEFVRNMLTIEEEPDKETAKNVSSKQDEFLLPSRLEEERQFSEYDPISSSSTEIKWDTSYLDQDWTQFANMLSPSQLEALFALISPSPNIQLERVADTYGTMPELIIDDINSLAMETIGDLIIDGDRIADEYTKYFEYLKGRSS
ncbi:hypothetical protein D3C73_606430 [compost metagenome]